MILFIMNWLIYTELVYTLCRANQLTGFFKMGTLVVKELSVSWCFKVVEWYHGYTMFYPIEK